MKQNKKFDNNTGGETKNTSRNAEVIENLRSG